MGSYPGASGRLGGFDPQKEYLSSTWELFRCCLVRTLLSYNGKPTDQGGSELYPDLAMDLPSVSGDGLTWTFHLKPGLHYAPPLEHVEIVARDIITALKRAADVSVVPGGVGYPFYYSVIRGFDAYRAGKASNIIGLQAPDDRTLIVRLNEPAGDLGYRLALPASAPIPPNPADPAAPFGAATGHDEGYGRYLVASGPYMMEGSENLQFSLPANDRSPVSGYVPYRDMGTSITHGSVTLVRNPSWDRSTDSLRQAYVDRIEVSIAFDASINQGSLGALFAATKKAMFDRVVRGDLDMVLDTSPPGRLGSEAKLEGRRYANEIEFVDYIELNLAVPPLNDIHVRKAINLAIDKTALERVWAALSGPIPEATGGGVAPTHIAPDAVDGGLLLTYLGPSWITSPSGADLVAARAEIRRSRYDHDNDGICDAAVCRHVRLVETSLWPRSFDPVVVRDLRRIGLEIDIRRYRPARFYAPDGPEAPQAGSAMVAIDWFNDYPNGSAFFPNLFGRDGCCNHALLGASPAQLQKWGYEVTEVKSVDDRIAQCEQTVGLGAAQAECWAKLDKYLMQKVVPWVPFLFQTATSLVSARVAHYSFDVFTGLPALDQIALKPGSS